MGNDVAPEVGGDGVSVDEKGDFLTFYLWSPCVDVGHIRLEDVNLFKSERKFSRDIRLERLRHCVSNEDTVYQRESLT